MIQPSSFFLVAVFAPIIGSILASILGPKAGDKSAQLVSIFAMCISALSAFATLLAVLDNHSTTIVAPVLTWIDAANLHISWSLRLDTLSVVMVAMVTFISTLVHIYSIGYMQHDRMPTYRFFAYISFFTFTMLVLVSSNDLVQLFFGWEGVGLASYLLIGYWYDRPSAAAAAIKAFVVNRIADLFFLVGIALLFVQFGSVSYDTVFALIPNKMDTTYHLFGTLFPAYEVIAMLLFIGAMGKSAQIILHVWLPDAMEGPTPVSALIHAATMVTAGIFLIARMSPLIEFAPFTKDVIVFIGGTTSFIAATIGLVQKDIKRTIAYSTCSQLGYMFIAAGVGTYQIGVFHLTTHAFFKALLFLSAGAVIHALHDEQDMFKMGGLWKRMPLTYIAFWIGSLALAGVFPFSGYWSKDAILEASWMVHTDMGKYAWVLGTVTAFITALYSWRLIFLVFHGESKNPSLASKAHDAGFSMSLPLIVLSFGAVFLGGLTAQYYVGSQNIGFWNGSIVNAPNNTVLASLENTPWFISVLPSIAGLLGIIAAYIGYMHKPQLPALFARKLEPIYQILVHKWYFDELYHFIFVSPYKKLSKFLQIAGEEKAVEGAPHLLTRWTSHGADQLVRLQTGSLAAYAFSMLIGLVVLMTALLVFR